MELKELLEMRPDTLANRQHEALKEHALSILEDIVQKIRKEDYDGILKKNCSFIKAVDGDDDDEQKRHFINFDYGSYDEGLDLIETVKLLEDYKTMTSGSKRNGLNRFSV